MVPILVRILVRIQNIDPQQMPSPILLAQTHHQQQQQVLQYPHLVLTEGEVVGALVDLLFKAVGEVVVEVPRMSQGQTNLSLLSQLHQPMFPSWPLWHLQVQDVKGQGVLEILVSLLPSHIREPEVPCEKLENQSGYSRIRP